MQNKNSLAATRRSCEPGRARMPVHYAGTVSRASKAPGAGLRTRRRTGLSSQQVVWTPEVLPLLFHENNLIVVRLATNTSHHMHISTTTPLPCPHYKVNQVRCLSCWMGPSTLLNPILLKPCIHYGQLAMSTKLQ